MTQECKHDYDNPIRLGRANYVCKDCKQDISLMVIMIEEVKQMTQEKKHSELPWYPNFNCHIDKVTNSLIIEGPQTIYHAKDKPIFINASGPIASKEDLRFIIKACNNFYPLLEACKEALKVFKDENTGKYFSKEISTLKQAIKSAEEV